MINIFDFETKEYSTLKDRVRLIESDNNYIYNFETINYKLSENLELLSKNKVVIYWVSRELRVNDNWSLIFASEIAKKTHSQLIVAYYLDDKYYCKNSRNYYFLSKGLIELSDSLKNLRIPFLLIMGTTQEVVSKFKQINPIATITDFYPLNDKRKEKNIVIENVDTVFFEVDSHNIVPTWLASTKEEFGAYTIRPKIKKLLPIYLTDFPKIEKFKSNEQEIFQYHSDVKLMLEANKPLDNLSPSDILISGEKEALKYFDFFKNNRLKAYNTLRNEPSANGQSGLSPYLNYGFLSNQRVAYEINEMPVASTMFEDKEAFLEEQIIRRELSDNHCYYNTNYDKFDGFHNWAKTTLNEHRDDKREYIYSLEQFESAKTHDKAWNAAQKQLTNTGKLQGYMRMYWAKKILEWTDSPETALEIAIYLNDYYALDGRDPNGFVGISWSIGGVHDRAWTERTVFGKIRFMNFAGLKRKYDIEKYINMYLKLDKFSDRLF